MKRLIIAFWAVLAFGTPAMATTYYVSNGTSNGYSTGSDSNTSTQAQSQSTPWASVAHAVSAASSGDTIVVNPSGTAYVENSGSGYLSVTKTITIEGDPSLVPLVPIVQTSSTSSTITVNTGGALTIANFIIDTQGNAKDCISAFQHFVSAANIKAVNVAANKRLINIQTVAGTAQTVTVDKCIMKSTDGNNASAIFVYYQGTGSSSDLTLSVTGCTVSGVSYFLEGSNAGTSAKSITLGTSSDGTRNSVSSCTYAVAISYGGSGSTVSSLGVSGTDFSGVTNKSICAGSTDYTITVSSLSVSGCTFSGSDNTSATDIAIGFNLTSGDISGNAFTGSHYNITSGCTSCDNLKIHNNVITTLSISNGQSNIALTPCGPGLQIYSNTISSSGNHVIWVGADTPRQSSASNTATSTGTVSLGQSASNVYADLPFTLGNINDGGNKWPAYVIIPFSAVGSPTGTITCKLYSDNAGNPGTLLDTSSYAAKASDIGTHSLGSPTWFRFYFEGRSQLSLSTQYHFVVQYTGTVDGTNYVTIPTNSAVGNTSNGAAIGTVQTSPDDTTWTAQTGKAALFLLGMLDLECVDPIVHDNVLSSGNNTLTHMILVGSTDGAHVYRNRTTGMEIGVIFKEGDGSVHDLVAYDNLLVANGSSFCTGIFEKGSRNAKYYHNTIVANSANGGQAWAVYVIGDYLGTSGYFNGTPSRYVDIRNNVIYATGSNASAYSVGGEPASGIAGGYEIQAVNPTIDFDCAYVANGSAWGRYNLGSFEANTNFNSFADVQALGFEAHGKNADPLLANDSSPSKVTDFIPSGTSPAINMGANLTAKVSGDYFSNMFTVPVCVGALKPMTRTLAPSRAIAR